MSEDGYDMLVLPAQRHGQHSIDRPYRRPLRVGMPLDRTQKGIARKEASGLGHVLMRKRIERELFTITDGAPSALEGVKPQ